MLVNLNPLSKRARKKNEKRMRKSKELFNMRKSKK